MLRSFVKGIFILGFAFLAAACGSEGGSSSGGGGGGKSSQEELLGYNPSSRWPDQGSYRYTMRQGSCVTEQRFENQASYCLGLMNQKLNNGCALEGRRSAYERN